VTPPDPGDVTTGELSRGLSRVEREMQAGFTAIRDEIRALAFVPAAVYASEMTAVRERVKRVEEAGETADQRAWQARLAITLAVVSMLLSIVGGLVLAALK
jgi:hypothetical protein